MPATITQSYAQIAKRYNLGTSGTTEGMKNLAMRWIEELTEEWLMIFDDCKLSDRRDHLPARAKGNVIYTSRSTELKNDLPHGCSLEVTPFTEADAVDLLLKVSGRQHESASSEDMDSARAIVRELGSLPLAIDKAAASIRDRGLALHDYLKQIRDRKVGILSDPRFKNRKVENPTVYATLELSYDAIMARRRREGRNGPGLGASMALKVLSLLSFYHYKEFPALRVFSRAAKERVERNAHIAVPLREVMDPPDRDFDFMLQVAADGEWDQHYFGVGLTVLEKFSLVKVDRRRGTVSMHVLVHRWARHRLSEKAYAQYSDLTRIMVTEAILVSSKWKDAMFTRELDPHLYLCHARGKLASADDGYLALLYSKLGWYYTLNKRFSAAERALSRCLHLWRVESGSYSWNVINVLNQLGELYHEMGRLGEAELAYVEIIERILGRIKDLEDAKAGGQNGQLNSWRRRASIYVSKRVRETLVKKLPGRLPQVSSRRSSESRGGTPSADGTETEGDKPKTSGKPPPADSDSEDGQEHIEDLWVYHRLFHADLARVYMDQGRHGMGKRMLVDSLRFLDQEGHITKDSIEYLRLEHEVMALTEAGNLQFWNKRTNDICDIFERGDTSFLESVAYFQLLMSHADAMLKSGMWDLALKKYRGTYKLFDKVWGPCDRRMLEILRRMVDCLVEGDQCDEAVETARKCVRRARRVYGQFHRETVLALEKLYEALFFQRLEHDEEGERILRRALFESERGLGLTHAITRRIRHRLRAGKRRSKQPVRRFRQGAEETEASCPWENAKATLEELRRELGPNHIITRRFARVVGNCPPKTTEEYVARVCACFGPHSSLTKRAEENLEMERSALAPDTESEGGGNSPRDHSIGSGLELCACGEPSHAEGS
jgi:tetratricopeptide (TPR) repeat protein